MKSMPAIELTVYDHYPPEESALVDRGLGQFNNSAAQLHEVRPISCFARLETGRVIGGATGRHWGKCCEIQQLWVEASSRRSGVGAQIIRRLEASASEHGCTTFYLETFNFQALEFYKSLGYGVELERVGFPHGIVKYYMARHIVR